MNSVVRLTGMYFHSEASRVGAIQRARAPADVAVDWETAQAVDAQRIERAVLQIGHHIGEAFNIAQPRLGAGGRLPHAACGIGARPQPGDRAARGKRALAVLVERIGREGARVIDGGVGMPQRLVLREPRLHLVDRHDTLGNIDDDHRAPALGIGDRFRIDATAHPACPGAAHRAWR